MAHHPKETTAMVSRTYFEQTALVHLDFLFNVAVKITRNEDDAQDLVQETFLRAFRFFDKYEPGTNCKAWLYRILKNTFINRYRQQHRRPSEVDFDAIEETHEVQVKHMGLKLGDPEESFMNNVLRTDVRQALDKLPADYREALFLSLVEGFSYREIAEMVGCPIGTVMSRIHRARKLMQRTLTSHSQGHTWSAARAVIAQGA
jgi:RNA polymerase sigma-70 factor (ECF subfamily)